jgi:hypothetical protein
MPLTLRRKGSSRETLGELYRSWSRAQSVENIVGVGILQQAGGARSPDATGSTGPSAPAVAANPREDEAARLTTELQTLVAGLLPPDAQLRPFPADPSVLAKAQATQLATQPGLVNTHGMTLRSDAM